MESNIILYTTDSGSVSIQVQYEDGTFWLTQKRMAELFGVDVRTVNYHLKEICNSEELTEEATIRKIRIVQQEGKRNVERELDFYHLKAILAVGYRVNSKEATAFRRWATNTHAPQTREFFATVQNKLHWAISGITPPANAPH